MRNAVGSNQILRLLFWESTIRCNLTCAHCRRIESDEQAHRDITTAQAKALIEQLAELGRGQPMMPVLVFSGGEPLCREDLFELVKQARSLGITPALATNGTLIDTTVAEQIRESGIARVSVSLDGATAEVHNKLRQLEGSFERAIEGIGHLRDRKVPDKQYSKTCETSFRRSSVSAPARHRIAALTCLHTGFVQAFLPYYALVMRAAGHFHL